MTGSSFNARAPGRIVGRAMVWPMLAGLASLVWGADSSRFVVTAFGEFRGGVAADPCG